MPETTTRPSYLIEFPATNVRSIDMNSSKARDFIKRNKIEVDQQFYFTDNSFRVLATLKSADEKGGPRLYAVPHWGHQEAIGVPEGEGE